MQEKLESIDQVLEVLAADKAWHSIDEIARRTDLATQETTEIIGFLAAHRFIILNKHGEHARIKADISRFLTDIRREEEHLTS
jgi:DNA-binding IclR family transcriptional regulator